MALANHFALTLYVLTGAGYGLLDPCLAQTDVEGAAFSLDPSPVAGTVKQQPTPTSIEWVGKEYDISEGVQALIRACSDKNTDPDDRAAALHKLAEVAPALRGTPSIPRLVELYEAVTPQEEKRSLVGCIAASNDPRGLPFFAEVLGNSTDQVQRFQAAYALARWNVRRGVRELIGMFDSSIDGRDGLGFGEQVVKVFQLLNLQKDWGAPDKEILQRIRVHEPELTKEQALSLYARYIKQWFTENEHRFPDWKPGDPLPKAKTSDRP